MQQRLKTVLGMYPTLIGLEMAVEAFRDAGFQIGDISLVLPGKITSADSGLQRRNGSAAPWELTTALSDLGLPRHEMQEYADKVLQGKALLSIHCDSAERALDARKLHGDLGGMDVFVAHCAGNRNRALACAAD